MGNKTNINPNIKKYYTLEEINKHKSENDCWIVANGKVYDVTQFLKIRPEHHERIFKNRFGDRSIDYDFHTKSQQQIWKKYEIGRVCGYRKNESCVIL